MIKSTTTVTLSKLKDPLRSSISPGTIFVYSDCSEEIFLALEKGGLSSDIFKSSDMCLYKSENGSKSIGEWYTPDPDKRVIILNAHFTNSTN